jgi:hypothetical protein
MLNIVATNRLFSVDDSNNEVMGSQYLRARIAIMYQ